MGLLKKVVFALFMSSAMIVTAPTVMAAGKQANQTQAGVVKALDDTVTAAENALEAIQNGTDKKTTMKLLKISKQTAKTIESSTVLAQRDKALSRVNKARSAYKKGQQAKAIKWMTEAVQRFKDVRTKYHNF